MNFELSPELIASKVEFMNFLKGNVRRNWKPCWIVGVDFLKRYDESARPNVEAILKKMEGKFGLIEGNNLDAARMIRPVLGKIPFAVGGVASRFINGRGS